MIRTHVPPFAAASVPTRRLAALLTVLLVAGCRPAADPDHLLAAGHVEATEVRIATKTGGTLERFTLEEGDRLEVGQEVARFDTVDQELALAAGQAERDLADAQLRLALAGFRREDVAQARAQVERAEVELAAASRDLERFEGLLAAGSGTEKTRDDARTRRDAAARGLEAARANLDKLAAGLRREEVDAARARFAAAAAVVAQLEQRVADATVRAPTAGVVTEKLVEEGEILAPGTTLLIATDLASARLVAWVPETELGRLRLGQEAEVVTDDGSRRTGRLTWISPDAEFTPKNVQTRDERVKLVYKVKVALPNEDGFYKPGMPAEAELRTAAEGGP